VEALNTPTIRRLTPSRRHQLPRITPGFPGREKIFTTANKIFTLSKVEPVGIMINGHVEHFGCPWEVIIKDFRAQLKDAHFPDLEQYAAKFIETVTDKKFLNSDAQGASMIHSTLSTYWELHRRIASDDTLRWSAKTVRSSLEEMSNDADKWPLIPGFEDVTQNALNAEYGSLVDAVLSDDDYTDKKIPKACRALFKHVLRSVIVRQRSTPYSTGIVITGYGRENLYPKLMEIAVDGGCLNRVRHFEVDKRDVKDDPSGAIISPFAQDEIVNTFVKGIDEKFSLFNVSLFTHLMHLVAEEILKEHTQYNAEERRVVERMVSQRMGEAFEEFKGEIDEFSADEYEIPMRDVLRSAPKEMLAELAESLVSITSLRQRVSGDLETVGGPVDVALISKGEGFIWIKRKHYFEPRLNPHYVRNYLREVDHGTGKTEASSD
jgi:hypothetical protein